MFRSHLRLLMITTTQREAACCQPIIDTAAAACCCCCCLLLLPLLAAAAGVTTGLACLHRQFKQRCRRADSRTSVITRCCSPRCPLCIISAEVPLLPFEAPAWLPAAEARLPALSRPLSWRPLRVVRASSATPTQKKRKLPQMPALRCGRDCFMVVMVAVGAIGSYLSSTFASRFPQGR
jgi:hypothetical protein